MSRRKGEIASVMNERDFPHIVELPLPSGGFRSQSDDMLAFRRGRGIEPRRGRGWHNDETLRNARPRRAAKGDVLPRGLIFLDFRTIQVRPKDVGSARWHLPSRLSGGGQTRSCFQAKGSRSCLPEGSL